MKLRINLKKHSAFLLVDCLIYISLFGLLLGLGFAAVYRLWEATDRIKHNAEAIALTLQAGERWREDIRRSDETRILEENGSRQLVLLKQGTNEVRYEFDGRSVWRKPNAEAKYQEILWYVKGSRIHSEARTNLTVWVWDLELESRRERRKFKPLFTFMAVPRIL